MGLWWSRPLHGIVLWVSKGPHFPERWRAYLRIWCHIQGIPSRSRALHELSERIDRLISECKDFRVDSQDGLDKRRHAWWDVHGKVVAHYGGHFQWLQRQDIVLPHLNLGWNSLQSLVPNREHSPTQHSLAQAEPESLLFNNQSQRGRSVWA